uniref:Ig-like domain-containing protein n=1 Tax=Catharus ustulatus TaxID=91951 RepID=A0A8C3UMT2_CATUS
VGSPETPQLLVEPPWTPAVLWDRVTLTCQGSGTTGATIWYKDGQRWGQEGRDTFNVTNKGTYQCQRPGSGLSPPVRVSNGGHGDTALPGPAGSVCLLALLLPRLEEIRNAPQ